MANYLLGFGERLTEKIDPPKKPASKKHAYSFGEARDRLAPRIQRAVADIDQLPAAACPHNESVAAITLHPSYLAKTFFPSGLLRTVGLEPVGSRPRQVIPEKGAKLEKKKDDKPQKPVSSPTADLFVSGSRRAFQRWAASFGRWTEDLDGAEEIIRIEDVRSLSPAEKIRPMRSKTDNPLLEVVLHSGADYILDGFREYLRGLDIAVDLDRRIQVQGLCFLPVKVPRKLHEEMAKFSFLRVAREMPSLRQLRPVAWTGGMLRSAPAGFKVDTPLLAPLNKDVRVAVFDGGVPQDFLPKDLVRRKRTLNIGDAVPNSQAHGLGVSSAILFGSLEKGEPAPQPFASIDHYRVLDKDTLHDPQGHYFDVLNRIIDVLRQNPFDFVNLSLGPDLPIEDDEVHVWTASLDEQFAHGKTLVTVAAGNSGEDDWDSGNARIQAPADAVNVLCVGASDSHRKKWKRASYSSIGPGRSPGRVKPEILAFGGSPSQPFWVLSSDKKGYSVPIQGTSFAAPLALRTAIGVKTYLGPVLQPLALKALLIHHSEDSGHDQREVGWGRIPSDIEDLILCPDGVAHILYQGELEPGRYLRARIPLPSTGLSGTVSIRATFCYATETDPQDPLNYTRAGLEVAFRPNKDKFTETEFGTSKNAATKSFFSSKAYATEEELRRDAHKWEPCLTASKKFRASSLSDPVFDVHYNARRGGASDRAAKSIPYALVVTVEAKQMADLYNKIALRYRTQLEELRPVIQIPIRTSGR
jgi:hypothetical protein